jgi:integrase
MALTPKKRVNKDGSETFTLRLDLGVNPLTGERDRPYINGRTEGECIANYLEERRRRKPRRDKTVFRSELTYSEWVAEWLAMREGSVRPKTWRNEKYSLHASAEPFLGRRKLREIDEFIIADWLVWLRDERGLEPGTRKRLKILVAQTFEAAKRWGVIPENVVRNVDTPIGKRSKEPVYLTDDELNRLDAVCQADELEPVWSLLIATGARISEVLGLRWDNVDLAAGHLRIEEQLVDLGPGNGRGLAEPKTPRGVRTVALEPWALERLRTYRAAEHVRRLGRVGWNPARFVVVTRAGKVPWAETINRRLEGLAKLAGVRPVTAHDFRHSHIDYLRRRGWPDAAIMARVGHASSRQLDTYTGRYAGDQAALVETLPARVGLIAETVWPNDGLMEPNGKQDEWTDLELSGD